MEKNDNNITIYSGIAFNDPTGDIKRIRSVINSLLSMVDDMNSAWDDATRINNISIRQNVMERLGDSIQNLMQLALSIDRMIMYDLRNKEV